MIRVLVVDDHPVVRSGIVAVLADATDVTVVGQAADGEQAVRLAAELRPDVVLMDLRMPVLDGAGATARIRAETPATKVLVLTTYENDDAILEAVGAGASGYLLKAAPERELLAAVRSAAAGATVLAPGIAAALVRGVQRQQSMPKPTARELEVLALVADGCSNAQIAAALFVSESTVKTHLLRLFERLGVTDRTRAVTRALELGLLPPR